MVKNVWVSSLNARFKKKKKKKKSQAQNVFRSQAKWNVNLHEITERFHHYKKNTMHLWARCFQLNWILLCYDFKYSIFSGVTIKQHTFCWGTGDHFGEGGFWPQLWQIQRNAHENIDYMTYFGQCEAPHSTACHPHAVLPLWVPNWSHHTLMCVCYSTSPSWRVQRLSPGDWPSPPVDICRLECKEGPQCTSVCCVSIPRILFPLTPAMFHVVKGGHVFTFLKCGWNSTLFAAIASKAGLHQKDRATSPVFRKNLGGRSQTFWRKIPHAVAHLVYLSKLQFRPGKACMTFRWKIHFTSRCQKFPAWATVTFKHAPNQFKPRILVLQAYTSHLIETWVATLRKTADKGTKPRISRVEILTPITKQEPF